MKSLNQRTCLITCFAALAASTFISGCSSSTKVSTAPTASVGQQLMDLDKAYQNGVITQKEYDKLKKEIIKKND